MPSVLFLYGTGTKKTAPRVWSSLECLFTGQDYFLK